MLLQHYFGKEPVENGMGEELPGWLDGREYSLSSPGAMTDAFSKSIKNGSFPNALNWLSKVGLTVPAAPGLAISASSNKSQGVSEPVGVSGTLDVLKQLLIEYQVKVPGGAPPVLCLDEANAMQSWTSEADLKDRKTITAFLVNVSSASIFEGCIEVI